MILLIDNYDSFSYNLYQLIGAVRQDIQVVRNDAMTVQQIASDKPDAIVLSPGPGRPADAGVCIPVVQALGGQIPILGVCLGHQAICQAYGGVVSYAKQLMHGKTSVAQLDTDSLLFRGMERSTQVARYHSLAAEKAQLPTCLRITAQTQDGDIMAVQHTQYPVYGVQFHPESVLTPQGYQMMENFLKEIAND